MKEEAKENESQWSGKSKSSLLGYQIFAFVLRTFGLKFSYFMLIFVALYFLLFSWKSTGASYRFFRKRLKWGRLKAVWGCYKTYYKFGHILLDRTALLAGLSTKFKFTFNGEEELKAMLEQDNASVLISGHFGNWEIAGHILKDRILGVDNINIVMLEAEHQRIQAFFDKIQSKRQLKVIGIKDDLSHIYKLGEAVSKKEVIAIHGDRFLPGNKTVAVDFLGEKAHFPAGPFIFAKRMKLPYTFVFGLKRGVSTYDLYALPAKVHQGSLEDFVAYFAEYLEKMIQKYPYQWFNFYDFWSAPKNQRNKPEEKKNNSKNNGIKTASSSSSR
ncbi:MAG: hypothetical protein MK212_14415 [Saprospiraceae bacterium]|nr:hypothetical protein [Saprospiraceae bacterium]